MSLETIAKAFERVESGLNQHSIRQAEILDRLTQLEQRNVMTGFDSPSNDSESFANRVVKAFATNSEFFAKTGSLRLTVSMKAAGDPVTTATGRKIVGVGVGAPQGGVLGLQSGIPTRNIGAVTVAEYSRYTGQEGAAGVQAAEGDSKSPVRPTHTLIQQPSITIAGYAKMSRQALNDSDEMRRVVETTLNRSVAVALDAALVDGVVAPAFAGFEALATASTSTVYTGLPDAVSEAVAAMQVDGFVPDVVALNPTDWLAVTTAVGGDGHYLGGTYLGVVKLQMRGLRVVLSPSIDVGKALVLDSTHTELLVVDGFGIELGFVDQDFTKNLVTILGEMRLVPVFRTVGSARLIAPKP